MTQSLLEIVFRTSKQGQGGKQAAAELKSLKDTVGEVSSNFLGFNAASVTAIGALAAASALVKSSVTEWSSYAEQIGQTAERSGIAAEEMSRLYQAADDMRVPVEVLDKAFATASKNGFQPSIENLAELADRLKGMSDPTARATELNRIFGKSWKDLYPLFKDGGDALREGTAAVAESLVVTEEAVRKNREYIKAVDDLGDAWQGVKNDIGQAVIPALTALLNAINDTNTAQAEAMKVEGLSHQQRMEYVQQQKARLEQERETAQALAWGKQAQEQFNASMDVGAGSMRNLGSAAEDATAGLEESGLANELATIKGSFGDLTAQMIWNKAAADLSAEGALELGRQLGIVDESSYEAQKQIDKLTQQFLSGKIDELEYIDRLSSINGIINGMQSKDVVVRVDTYYNEHYDKTGRNVNPQPVTVEDIKNKGGYGNANGTDGWVKVPPGYPGDTYPVLMSSGEEFKVKNDRQRWTGGDDEGRAAVVIKTVNISNGMTLAQFEQFLIDTERKARRG